MTQNRNEILAGFLKQTAGVDAVLVASEDGLLLGHEGELYAGENAELREHMSAVIGTLASLTGQFGRLVNAGGVTYQMVAFDSEASLLVVRGVDNTVVTAVVSAGADLEHVTNEVNLLALRRPKSLSVESRSEPSARITQ